MLTAIVGFFVVSIVVVLIGTVIIAPFFYIFVKPQKCPACDRDVRLAGKTAKCKHCKTKLFKHSNGRYMVRI